MLSNRNHVRKLDAGYNLIHCLLLIARNPNVMPFDQVSDPEAFLARDEYERTGFYFPGRPIQAKVANCILSKSEDKEPPCNKEYKEAGKFGAGMALFWCARHRECIGWILLERSESLEILFSSIVTRFRKIPNYIIYDNGCNFYEYCVNRAPDLFSDTVFLSDGFHWSNHRNCSSSFNSCLIEAIKGISSVTHEQKNSNLAKFKAISTFMRFDTFSQTMHYVLHNMNYRERGYKLTTNYEVLA